MSRFQLPIRVNPISSTSGAQDLDVPTKTLQNYETYIAVATSIPSGVSPLTELYPSVRFGGGLSVDNILEWDADLERLVFMKSGVFNITVTGLYTMDPNGTRFLAVEIPALAGLVGAAVNLICSNSNPGASSTVTVNRTAYFHRGDSIRLFTSQDSGIALNFSPRIFVSQII